MKWTKLILIVVCVYLVYFSINLIVDVIRLKKDNNNNNNNLIKFEDIDEEEEITTTITNDFSLDTVEPKEEINVVSVEKPEEIKLDSKEEETFESEKKKDEYEDLKFQSIPINEFIINVKTYSSQIDF
ncbi:hypothetical protein [Tenacibaculum finnmarkense]|uniref:hypothetical protein n=1 Tax=Tenacibaculum finnmarkense TaxID=2781243 RepID=UPI001EFB320F|nr:hypothetical protein [Tenacibaculum finnmarkense]MCG8226387.1 hypothetical protein [Tenacibaculum finnmarkense genomovar finnmarkense]